ncbi:MAG: hypothetical protein LBE13_10455 [Bacteroidales bacterium]|jgi:hypothetical protein|nr:hypothetical protein [Bacteroidales bacterium]
MKSKPKIKIHTFCLVYAYSQKELNDLENYWVSFKLRSKEYPDSMNLRPGGMQPGMSDETRLLISIKNKGRQRTDEQRKKISEGKKKYYARNPSSKAKINVTRIKPVVCIETGKKFTSSVEAMKYIRGEGKITNNGAILGCCKRLKKRKTAGGYHWMFLDEYLIQGQQSSALYENFFEFSK